MVTAAHSKNSRNQLTCVEKDKPKNNNKIRQHEKIKPVFQFLLSFFLVQTLFCSNNHHCDCHHRPMMQRPPATHAASPLPPPSPLPCNKLPPPTHHCCCHHHHAAVAFPNALLLPLKLRFHQAAASAAKLADAPVLLLPPPLMPRCQRHTTAYKI